MAEKKNPTWTFYICRKLKDGTVERRVVKTGSELPKRRAKALAKRATKWLSKGGKWCEFEEEK